MYLTTMRSANRSASSRDNNDDRGHMLVDGGCDTTLVGKGFVVKSTADRTVNVQGFQENMQLNSVPIVTAVTAIDLDKETSP